MMFRCVMMLIVPLLFSIVVMASCSEPEALRPEIASPSSVSKIENKNIKTINIMELESDPMAYTGIIAVKGVVQAVDKQRLLFRMIDEQEYKSCGLSPCSLAAIVTFYAPDKTRPLGSTPSDYIYEGKMPEVETIVTVEGEIKKVEDGFTFELQRVLQGSKVIIKRIQ